MKASIKLLLALAPFLAAGAMASRTVYPAFHDDQQKRADVASKKQDNDQLLAKLKERTQAESDRKLLQSDIEQLRGSVPKSPELDLFMLDLERMCKQSNVYLIGVESPEAETLRALDASQDAMKSVTDMTANGKWSMGSKTIEKRQGGQAQDKTPKEDQTALKQLIKQVYVTGDYDGIVALMKKLESYQRVTGVKQVCVGVASEGMDNAGGNQNPAGERAKEAGIEIQSACHVFSYDFVLPSMSEFV